MANLFEELTWRELVYDATEGAADLLTTGSATAYAGFDPTAFLTSLAEVGRA